jgi:hypothetical protein
MATASEKPSTTLHGRYLKEKCTKQVTIAQITAEQSSTHEELILNTTMMKMTVTSKAVANKISFT